MQWRDITDCVWPTLAPLERGYHDKHERRLRERIQHVRSSCDGDIEKQRRFLESVRKEFEDEEARKESVTSYLQGLLALAGVIVAMIGGVSLWLVQSHTLRASAPTAILVALVALYPTLQMIGAFIAAMSGLRVRSFQALPHTAEALGDPMDAAEEITRACLFNTHQIDDRVSYKKLANRFLSNAAIGCIPLVLGMTVIAVRNLVQ
jgi:hypothetical protein